MTVPKPTCPLCRPDDGPDARPWIADLDTTSLYLEHDQTYRGYCVLVYRRGHVAGIEHLVPDERDRFLRDFGRAAAAVQAVFRPDHMNYAMLGNLVPHLHAHLIPRYRDDPRWGRPIWSDAGMPAPIVPAAAVLADRVDRVRQALAAVG